MKIMQSKLIVNTDGGARGNPGPAAIGVVISDLNNKVLENFSEYLGEKTNNEAEYLAVIAGLRLVAKYKPQEVIFKIDSELVVRQLNGVYKIKQPHLQELFILLQKEKAKLSQVKFTHVMREDNSQADSLVNKCLDREGY